VRAPLTSADDDQDFTDSEQRTSGWKCVTPQRDLGDEAMPSDDLDAAMDLRHALAQLPPKQRVAVVLRYYGGLPVDETAVMLDCSTTNVKSQTSYGLFKLRQKLESGPVASQ
jgi:RNA polymerase sigma factor (sigma-70 family)